MKAEQFSAEAEIPKMRPVKGYSSRYLNVILFELKTLKLKTLETVQIKLI